MIESANEIIEKLARVTPGWLAKVLSRGKWRYAPHLQMIDIALARAAYGLDEKNVMVNMPPRHGKSELISKYFPAWYLTNFPEKRIILTSYGAGLASQLGMKARNLIEENSYFLRVEIDRRKRSSDEFHIAGHSGGMTSVGACGAITGKGADQLIIDDPVKNQSEANSALQRDKLWDWFRATAQTRLEPGGITLLVMTRWHEDDLCGRIIVQNNGSEGGEWLIIRLPALAEENDPLGRKPGEALWPDRFPLSRLRKIKRTAGSFWFAGLYQQQPSPAQGAIFRRSWFRYYSQQGDFYILKNPNGSESKIFKEDCRIFAVMDLAARATESADYTVLLVFALTPDQDYLLLDLTREKFEAADHLRILENACMRWRPLMVGIESVQYQIALVQSARRKGLPVKELKATKDKVSRSLLASSLLEAGKIWFPPQSPWLEDFENELLLFPNGRNDDQVDAFAYMPELAAPVTSAMPAAGRKSSVPKKGIASKFG